MEDLLPYYERELAFLRRHSREFAERYPTRSPVSYPIVADGRRAFAYEVYSIASVKRVRQPPQGEAITEFRPFFSLLHGETPEQEGNYWFVQRNELVADKSPGYDMELSLVDADFDPVQPKTDILSLQL